ncbi:hypothetical protein O1611_g204 [Lasiodiplodia mahajangana]|uniref:Uncharacterized protein n=1 Tax=Lasiodiplodia mahajangana TaxID=1108764 RepID=A0ACC2K1H0_9PEZI|nr:hypothetical protein O1611_g204 [Lasiodiplodia mahajangana]
MDSKTTIASSPLNSFEAATTIPIAELSPDVVDPASKAVGGVVTITWPYNKVRGTFALNLAEPDFRLRRNKGQVRVDFTGRAAKAVGDLFSETLLLRIKRADTSQIDLVVVNEQAHEDETALDSTHIQPLDTTNPSSPPATPSPIHITSPVRGINTKRLHDGEFASPAFIKRARMSYGSLFEDGFDIFQEDGGEERRGRKRTRFGRDSSAWRYTSRSPTPEPAVSSHTSGDEQVSSPTRVAKSPTRVETVEEACQTTELDQPSPSPTGTSQEAETEMIITKPAPVNDKPSDTPTEAALEQGAQTIPSNDLPPESTEEAAIYNTSAPISSQVSLHDVGTPTPVEVPRSIQQFDSPGYNFPGNSWNVDTPPPSFGSLQKASFPTSHVNESLPSSGFEGTTSGNEPISLNEPDSLSQSHQEVGEVQESINDDIIHSTEFEPPPFTYPPLETAQDSHPQPIHDEALANYPTIYLEGTNLPHMPGPSQRKEEQTHQHSATAEVGSGSWATVNHSSLTATIPPPDRFESRDGDTPEQALVIDESDSDSDAGLEPIAIEDTVNGGRAYDLGTFEDAEAEDEVDAQYSDDDEPEYEEEEMGGDYDTRNYEQPADDEDDSHDEDLKPHSLDAEFEDGESWDEEEQEEFIDEEDEAEYDMDEEVTGPSPQRATQAGPTVIDLISSSEDESEDEDEGEYDNSTDLQRPDIRINPRTSPDYQQSTMKADPQQSHIDDQESDIISQAPISEADSSSETSNESHEYASSHEEEEDDEVEDEEEREDEEATGDEIKLRADEQGDTCIPEPSENEAERNIEPEIEAKSEVEAEADATLSDTRGWGESSSHQKMPATELHERISIQPTTEIPVDDSAIVPLSAADGLEILSRAVDEESNATSQSVLAESVAEKVIAEPIYDEKSPAEPTNEGSIESHHPSNDQESRFSEASASESGSAVHAQNSAEYQPDQVARSEPGTEHSPFVVGDSNPKITAPSSPPLTQSFQSHIEHDKFAFEERTLISTTEVATTHLITPLDTQVTDTELIGTTNTSMHIGESFESYASIEQQIIEDIEGSLEGPAEGLAPQSTDTDTEKGGAQQEREIGRTMEPHAQPSLDKPSTASSPAPSFETQVEDEELDLPNSIQQTEESSQLPQGPSLEYNSSASDTGKSFASNMEVDEELQASILEDSHLEVDEELQASILEDSQLGEYFTHDLNDKLDEPAQIDESEAHPESNYTGEAEAGPSLLRENTPSMQLAEEISAQLRRNFVVKGGSSGEDSDTSTPNDPSVSIARAANASKKKRKRATSSPLYRPRKRLFDARRSPTPETDDSSVQLARISITSQTSILEEESTSMTAAKLQLSRHLRDELPDCTPLEGLRHHLTKSLDVIAVAVMQPPSPRRAKSGPREYMMSFTVSDYTIGPYAVVEALLYRPHKDTLPIVKYGDIVLLKNFTVVSLPDKGFGLRSNDGSSWAVFDYEGEPAQIRGPPVEYNGREMLYVSYLRDWFKLLSAKARSKLERVNQEFIGAGKSK